MGALGTIANFGAAGAALALWGPYWGVVLFLSIALVRITLDAHVLRRENEVLREHVASFEEDLVSPEADAPPESGTRPSRTLVEKRARRSDSTAQSNPRASVASFTL